MKIIIIRHGETELNYNKIIQGKTTNPSLNDNGRKQILYTAKKISELGYKINFVQASPLKRAVETAEIIKQELDLNLEIIINNDFVERDFGPYEGKDIKILPYYGKTLPGYETNEMLCERMQQSLNNLLHNYNDDSTTIICSHSHAIKGMLVSLFPRLIRFDSRIKNGDFFVIEITNDNTKLLFTSYNSF